MLVLSNGEMQKMSIKCYDQNDNVVSTKKLFMKLSSMERKLWKKMIYRTDSFEIVKLEDETYKININGFYSCFDYIFLERYMVDCSDFPLKKVIYPDVEIVINDMKIK